MKSYYKCINVRNRNLSILNNKRNFLNANEVQLP